MSRSPSINARWTLRVQKDWLEEWKKYFKPFQVGQFRVTPSWIKAKKKKTNQIIIEPGMAFGTGTHATTQFAMRLLQHLKKEKSIDKALVLDVGAGSGILSVAAAKLGARKVTAIDNDPECWRECKKTFKLNGAKKCGASTQQIDEIQKKFDIVVANIIDGVLMQLKKDLWRIINKEGFLILSGILTDGARAFEKDFLEGTSGKVIKRLKNSEWTALIISK